MKEDFMMSGLYIHSQHKDTYAHRTLAQRNKTNCKVGVLFMSLIVEILVCAFETQEFI